MGSHKNTFFKGMNKDTSMQKYPQDQYENARNVRPITDSGLSTGALENIKGTEQLYEFPEITGKLTFKLTKEAYANNSLVKTEYLGLLFADGGGPPYTAPYGIIIATGTFQFKTPEEYF
jgi:hypothetical protein